LCGEQFRNDWVPSPVARWSVFPGATELGAAAQAEPERKRDDLPRAARALGLKYVPVDALEIERRRHGAGFTYVGPDGDTIRDPEPRERIKKLAIPPAWEDVRIALDPKAHIQAVGRDEAGRAQYLYHEHWEELREKRKAARLRTFAKVLPKIRVAVARDLKRPAGDFRLALAAGVALIDEAAIRVGNEAHMRRTGARGAVTLRQSHVQVQGAVVSLKFRAKGGKTFETEVESPRLSRALKRLKRLSAGRLLSYRREDGTLGAVSAQDLNAYLKELSCEPVSAKDFRTFHATALALDRLASQEPESSNGKLKKQLVGVAREVSELLGNTPAIARKSYVLVSVVTSFMNGGFPSEITDVRPRANLKKHEVALARFFAQQRQKPRRRKAL